MNDIGSKSGMTVIVKTVTRLTLGFILLYGIYVALSGEKSPGGGFAGGVIVALSMVHVMLAYGKRVALNRMHAHVMRIAVSAAALVFVLVNVRWLGWERSFGFVRKDVVLSFCEMVIVGAGLFAIFVALVLLSKSDRDSE